MTKQIDQVALQRLRSCFSMLGTDNDAEALNALSRCKEILTRRGLE